MSTLISLNIVRAVIKRRGPEISPRCYEHGPQLISKENKRKIEPKEIFSCLIPRLLVVFTLQLEISDNPDCLIILQVPRRLLKRTDFL